MYEIYENKSNFFLPIQVLISFPYKTQISKRGPPNFIY